MKGGGVKRGKGRRVTGDKDGVGELGCKHAAVCLTTPCP